jgi:hypothetical protein
MKLLFAFFSVLLLGAAFCISGYSSVRSGFDQKMLEGEWRRKPFFVIRSAASPAWLLRASSHGVLFFSDIGAQGLGVPKQIFMMTQDGAEVVERGGTINGGQLFGSGTMGRLADTGLDVLGEGEETSPVWSDKAFS